uniref:Uncharacterized protein n=1 Tax=Amphimedon queenslandica TaxID=400682 RepID=A0A1X7T5S5_AMPQE
MATSNSDKVQESFSNLQYRRSASPEVVCFSEPEIMPENDKTTIKGAQHDGYHKAWKRKNALKRKKISDTGPSETSRESFNNGGSFKRSSSNPELHQGGEGEGADEQQQRRRGVQFLQVPSNRRLVTRSAAGISRIRPSPLVTSSLTCYSNMNEIDGDMELVPELDFRQYHLDVDSDENDDDSSNEGEGKEVDKELEGQELERQEYEKLMNGLIVDPPSMPQNLPNIHHTKQISGVSLTGYQGDEEVLSEDDRWLSRPSDDAGMTRLHSQELLNELFFKFKYVHPSLKHHGRRRTFRKRVATESTRKISALDMIQKRNSDAIITNDHSLSEEEEDKKELEKKKEGEREKARRATMQADFSLYDTKKKKKERKVLESIVGAGASLSPPPKKTRAQSVLESAGPTSINKHKLSSPNLSLLDRKKLPVSPKAPHFIKLKLHNPKSAEKLLKHLEMKKYDQVQRNERMDTPLHAIVRSDRKDKLECLLILMVFSDFGTENIGIPAAFGNTALHIAVQKGDLLMVRLLLVFGANIDAINDRKRTPLDMLINGGNDKKFSKIIEELKRFDAKHGKKLDIACVVSIGTGIFPAIKLGSIDAHKFFSVKAFGNLITLLSKALVESEDVAMNCKSRCEEQHIPFFRFSPHLDTEVASGETDNDKLIDMILQTKYQAVKEWNEKLEDLACIFSRIEEYSRKQMIQKLRDRRRLQTMISQNDVIPEEQ